MAGNARQAFAGKQAATGRQYYTDGSGGGLLHICFYAILLARDITQSRFIRPPCSSARFRPDHRELSSAKNPVDAAVSRLSTFLRNPLSPLPCFSRGILERWWWWLRDLRLNLFTENVNASDSARSDHRSPSTPQLAAILFVFTYGQR